MSEFELRRDSTREKAMWMIGKYLLQCVISGFRRGVKEIRALLGYYAA
jgi:hypothetical protein